MTQKTTGNIKIGDFYYQQGYNRGFLTEDDHFWTQAIGYWVVGYDNQIRYYIKQGHEHCNYPTNHLPSKHFLRKMAALSPHKIR